MRTLWGIGDRCRRRRQEPSVVRRCHAQVVFADRAEESLGGPVLDLPISVGRALSRDSESRSTEPP